ncbi:Rare lipoprotein A precursor [Cronobacter turicensis 564]|nr:Rare lipoprotein A precursor [Cronobacter turicensis 564]
MTAPGSVQGSVAPAASASTTAAAGNYVVQVGAQSLSRRAAGV